MKTNRDLLKEAIADAKTVKETALANAKASLEEAFTPHLTSMISSKLEEMESEEEVNLDEMETDEMDELNLDEEISEDEDMVDEAKKDDEAEDEAEETEDEEADEEMDIEDMTEEDLKEFVEDIVKEMVQNGELEAETEETETEEVEETISESEETEEDEIDIDELLAEIEGEEGMDEQEEVNEYASEYDAYTELARKYCSEHPEDKMCADLSEGKKVKAKKMEDDEELKEAYNTIKTLRSDLQEINLLNAKLLYVNKIFKAKNLTEAQKVRVLESFDKTTNVKEVKLVYETLTEGLKEQKKPIHESFKKSASSIITGKTAKPILEADDQFARWKKLAGIKN